MNAKARGPVLPKGAGADVLLVLEGTYPFVRGGVSSWVHQIVTALPELKFALVFLGGAREKYEKVQYTLPPNVVHLEEHYLAEVPKLERIATRKGDPAFAKASRALHAAFTKGEPHAIGVAVDDVVGRLLEDPIEHEKDFLFGESAWSFMVERYEAVAPDRSFLDWFWSIRSMHAPLFLGAKIAAKVPPAKIVHVVSTGFAGFLAALIARRRGAPLILTEHGIYTKERRIELLQATWVKDEDGAGIGPIRSAWIRYFELLAKITYAAANPIVSLYQGNRARQIADGADPSRTIVVPNGIDLPRFAPLRTQRPATIPRIMGLVGRVVPIKDVKTFLRAIAIARRALPDIQGWIVGPEDEDETYAEECHDLARALELGDSVKFLGFRKVEEILPQLGCLVLTSISEAQPLSILEGFAAGVPAIATDVGCCAELIHGASREDRLIGSAGEIVPIADPEATANAAVALLGDPLRHRDAQAAGIARVEREYGQGQMVDRYRRLYSDALATAARRAAGERGSLRPSRLDTVDARSSLRPKPDGEGGG